MLVGERHLVVPASSEAAFKRALREVGYLVAIGEAKPAKPRRKPPVKQSAPGEPEPMVDGADNALVV